jgi:hypothetical protein
MATENPGWGYTKIRDALREPCILGARGLCPCADAVGGLNGYYCECLAGRWSCAIYSMASRACDCGPRPDELPFVRTPGGRSPSQRAFGSARRRHWTRPEPHQHGSGPAIARDRRRHVREGIHLGPEFAVTNPYDPRRRCHWWLPSTTSRRNPGLRQQLLRTRGCDRRTREPVGASPVRGVRARLDQHLGAVFRAAIGRSHLDRLGSAERIVVAARGDADCSRARSTLARSSLRGLQWPADDRCCDTKQQHLVAERAFVFDTSRGPWSGRVRWGNS